METDFTIEASDKFLDLDNELPTSDSLLFSREDYPISELLFDPADNDFEDDMFHSSVFDAASTEIDASSRIGSNTTTPPFRPGVHDPNVPGAVNQDFHHQLPYSDVRNGARMVQAPCVESEFLIYGGAGLRRHGNQEYARQLMPHNPPVPMYVGGTPTPFQLPSMRSDHLMMSVPPVSGIEGRTSRAQPIEPPIYPRPTSAQIPLAGRQQDTQFQSETPLGHPNNRFRSVQNVHSRDREHMPRYVCGICRKVFKRGHNLKIHQRLHTGYAPYACPFPGCVKEYKWKSSIVSHINWHRNKKGHTLPGYDTVSSLVKRGREVKNYRDHVPVGSAALTRQGEEARVPLSEDSGVLRQSNGLQASSAARGNVSSLPQGSNQVHVSLPRLQPLRMGPLLPHSSDAPDSTVGNLPSVSSLRLPLGSQSLHAPYQTQQGTWNGQSNWQSQQGRQTHEGRQPQEIRHAQDGLDAREVRQAREKSQANENRRLQETRQAQHRGQVKEGREARPNLRHPGPESAPKRLPAISTVSSGPSYSRRPVASSGKVRMEHVQSTPRKAESGLEDEAMTMSKRRSSTLEVRSCATPPAPMASWGEPLADVTRASGVATGSEFGTADLSGMRATSMQVPQGEAGLCLPVLSSAVNGADGLEVLTVTLAATANVVKEGGGAFGGGEGARGWREGDGEWQLHV